MPSLGPAEILVILVIALLVFGPNKMPDIARQVGKGMRELKRMQEHLGTELRDVVSEFDGPTDAAPTTSGGGDPVPMLPPKDEPTPAADVAPAVAVDEDPAAAPAAPAPSAAREATEHPPSPAVPERGQRVWPPVPPTGV